MRHDNLDTGGRKKKGVAGPWREKDEQGKQ